jgi:nucleoside-diphosphate-sugar epimerase
MKILFSGASSFTGSWFCRTLASQGHEVTALYTRSGPEEYEGTRSKRVKLVVHNCNAEYSCVFGSSKFLEVASHQPWDVYCHHAADVTNYRSPDFDPLAATAKNTHNLAQVLRALTKAGCSRVIYTGSIFEGGEGAGSDDLPHISPYGLSKALSWEVFRHHCAEQNIRLDKFVIPNPFGPQEEPRFTNFLIQQWKQNKTPSVRTPLYVRDNIHVDLLALEYAELVRLHEGEARKFQPSGYIESQGDFARRFAKEIQERTDWNCPVTFEGQTDFSEPMIRVNTRPSAHLHPGWSESKAWDEIADFYRQTGS